MKFISFIPKKLHLLRFFNPFVPNPYAPIRSGMAGSGWVGWVRSWGVGLGPRRGQQKAPKISEVQGTPRFFGGVKKTHLCGIIRRTFFWLGSLDFFSENFVGMEKVARQAAFFEPFIIVVIIIIYFFGFPIFHRELVTPQQKGRHQKIKRKTHRVLGGGQKHRHRVNAKLSYETFEVSEARSR